MFSRLPHPRKVTARLVAVMSVLWLAACDVVPMATTPGGGTPIRAGETVQVALLVPAGSGQATDELIARDMEAAARLAVADLQGAAIDLRVYNTAGDANQAAQAAASAVNDGARIILGPLYGAAANAAGVAVAGSGVSVLAFSNNPTIAGGNVFILGSTFQNTANRLVSYGRTTGLNSYVVVHADDLQGTVGRDAIVSAVRNSGGTVAGDESYPLSQQGVLAAGPRIARAARSAGADALFLTGGVNAELPILATTLPESGLPPSAIKYVGLTRWDSAPQALSLPGLQGGLFAVPDPGLTAGFERRFEASTGRRPHPLATLGYDGIAAIGSLVAQGGPNPLSRASLTQGAGFRGAGGSFRLLPNGLNERALAVATIQNNQVVIVDPAPRSFGGAGF